MLSCAYAAVKHSERLELLRRLDEIKIQIRPLLIEFRQAVARLKDLRDLGDDDAGAKLEAERAFSIYQAKLVEYEAVNTALCDDCPLR